MAEKINQSIPLFASVIVALAFILLMVVFRSILVPLKAVLGFILSLLASMGITTLIMQDGVMSELFGIDTPGPLFAMLPVILISLLFRLAMDYEVFLMSRIHEEYNKTKDNKLAVKLGIKKSGPVIVAAALIMFSVFIAFVFQEDPIIKSMGLSLALGVLFDAFIVRLTLIPALTTLLGKATWFVPAWLSKPIPHIDIEGRDLEHTAKQNQTSHQPTSETNMHINSSLMDQHIEVNEQNREEILDILKQQSKNIESINNILADLIKNHKCQNEYKGGFTNEII